MPAPRAEDTAAVSYDDILQASERLRGVANRTPVLTARSLDAMTGGRLFLKCENFQRTGAFKFRGAYNALSRLPESQRQSGVLTYSSGNHAQALALAGSLLGIDVTVIMPDDAPKIKQQATRGYGAEIIPYDKKVHTREDLAREIAIERGMPVIPPYDHPMIVAGQGTVGLELFERVSDLDVLLVCCGGGGLLSGCAIAARAARPDCHVVGVEPAAADDATRSFYSGTLQTVHNPDTIADGARTPYLGTVTFPLVQSFVNEMVTVSEEAIIRAMQFLWERMKIIVEPTGAVALAAVFAGRVPVRGKKVGLVVSGGNVDPAWAISLFQRLSDPGTNDPHSTDSPGSDSRSTVPH